MVIDKSLAPLQARKCKKVDSGTTCGVTAKVLAVQFVR
jgi:hypothetical protein